MNGAPWRESWRYHQRKPDEWFGQAACRDLGDRMFPPSETRGHELQLAKQTCIGCPVRVECLADALELNEAFGVRGGLSTPERQALAAGAPIQVCRRCGLPYAAIPDHGRCQACKRTRVQYPPAVHDPTPDRRCGTRAGCTAHQRRGERPCGDCHAARNAGRTRPRPRDVPSRRCYDPHNVEMAVGGNPPATLTTTERRAVCKRLADRRLPWPEMARLLRCSVRNAERTMAWLREHDAWEAA